MKSNKSCLITFFIFLFVLLGDKCYAKKSDTLNIKDIYVRLHIEVYSEEKKDTSNVLISIDNSGDYYLEYRVKLSESINLDIPLGDIYNLKFSAAGYLSKWIVFNAKDSIPQRILKNRRKKNKYGSKVFLIMNMIKASGIPDYFSEQLQALKPIATLRYSSTKDKWDYNKQETITERDRIAMNLNKISHLKADTSLLTDFLGLSDSLKKKRFELLSKNEQLLNHRILALESSKKTQLLESEKKISEAELEKSRAIALANEKDLRLSQQLRLIQEQRNKQLMLESSIERQRFLTQQMATDEKIKQERLLNYTKGKELLLTKREKELMNIQMNEEKNKKKFALAVVIFLLILAGLFIRAFYIKRKTVQFLAQQNSIISRQNSDILDSIEYAKRIQTAILPPPRIVKEFLKNSFVLYLPKDIVAGDFYWMESIDNTIYFAACDCTGHGVPGAMVSVVCNNALNRSVNEFGERLPGKIFDKTRELVLENFAKSDEEVNDGMDASLCALDVSTGKLYWCGANNPLWIYRAASKSLEEIKPDKQAIGRGYEGSLFTTHELQLQKGDTLYLFTDGYADQFGGEKGKKLTKARFREILVSMIELPMDVQREKLLAQHDAWRGKLEQVDDICVMGVRV